MPAFFVFLTALMAALMLPFPLYAAATQKLDIPYVPAGGHKQQLDLYVPEGQGFPTVLFVHGGSLTQGDRKDAPYPGIGQAFQQAGVACAVMSYRLAPEA